MPERRELTHAEKSQILTIHGLHCFINGHPLSEDELEFDHILPVAVGGTTTLDNLAPVCRKHNRQKGTMSLSEYRDYLKLGAFFDDGSQKYLDDVILAKGHKMGQKLRYEVAVS